MPDWLPDWENPSEYPDPDTTTMNQWAWEFLRRNPLYQKDFKLLIEKLIDIGFSPNDLKKTGDPKKDVAEIRLRRAFLNAEKATGGKSYGTIFDTYIYGVREIIERYKVTGFLENQTNYYDVVPDPSISIPERVPTFLIDSSLHFFELVDHKKQKYFPMGSQVISIENFIKRMDKDEFTENRPRHVSVDTTPRFLLTAINLEKPIRSQLDMIKKVAEQQKAQLKEWNLMSTGRIRKDNYCGYLRILDAVTMGESRLKIIEILFPDISNEYPDYHANKYYDNWLKRAVTIRDYDYIKIAALNDSEFINVKLAL